MENDETLDIQEEQQVDEVVEVEETLEEETPKAETVNLTPAEYRHFKKWEASNRQPAPKASTPQAPQNIEETVLLATGMPEELVKELKVIAQVRGVSLVKAQNDPIFTALKETFEKEKKKDEASLPASRGSATTKPKRDFTSPGLTREEHMELVSKMQ